jgi:hypothetical protein
MLALAKAAGVAFSSGKAAIAAGGTPGVPYVITQVLTSQTAGESVTISNPALGYRGSLQIFLAGWASQFGYSYDAIAGCQASGETGEFNYTCLGDEVSFTVMQTTFNVGSDTDISNCSLRLTVNGGANDGKYVIVGSGKGNGGYGNAGAPYRKSDLSTLVAPTRYGAYRNPNTNFYSDATNYAPLQFATYGDTYTGQSYSLGSNTLTVYYAATWSLSGYTSAGGLVYNGTAYGVALIVDSGQANGQTPNTRPTAARAFCILNFKNDV